MRASIAIAAHNEGVLLSRTVRSCLETTVGLDCEVVVVDDGSTDGSVEAMERDFPSVRVVRRSSRCGTSAAKDLSVRESLGEVVVVLDGHNKPEMGAIERIVEDVELSGGRWIVSPTIQVLNATTWENDRGGPLGYWVDLEWFISSWLDPEAMPTVALPGGRTLLKAPSFVGCSFAIGRNLYDEIGGFDVGLLTWGSDDADLSIRASMLGVTIALDPESNIGHRFRSESEGTYEIPSDHCLYNQIRMARRNFGDAAWEDWRSRMEAFHATRGWASAWAIFEQNRESIERERRALLAARVHDEYWYANEFGLAWPLTLPGSPIPAPAVSARPRYDRPCPISASMTRQTVTPVPTTAPERKPVSPFVDRLPIAEPVGSVLVG